jgi:hypothetical protein
MRYGILFLVVFLNFVQCVNAQKIDNMASFRDINTAEYFRFHYDNDYFAASDKNYTQGYSFELVAPYLAKNPLNYLLFKPDGAETRYGLAVEHIGFTPDNYASPEIQVGDRPFAAAIMLKTFSISTNTEYKSRFTTSLNTGIIGPGAFGKEMQVGIHEATGNKIPMGWRHQIRNDLVFNYEMGYEKQLLSIDKFASLQATAKLKAGTLFTNGTLGLNATVGIVENPFRALDKSNGFELYAYIQPQVRAIGYDATLQGGLFNKSSPYTIASGDVERFTAQTDFGIVLKTKTLYFEYTRSVVSKEYETGSSYKWGGIRIGFTL